MSDATTEQVKHTPAKWTCKRVGTSVGHAWMFEPVGACLYVDGSLLSDSSPIRLEAEANAHLIAASPDLLAVLQELLGSEVYADAEGLLSIRQGGCDDDDHRAIVAKCDAAIAAATGATP